jgi:hypothetical protein
LSATCYRCLLCYAALRLNFNDRQLRDNTTFAYLGLQADFGSPTTVEELVGEVRDGARLGRFLLGFMQIPKPDPITGPRIPTLSPNQSEKTAAAATELKCGRTRKSRRTKKNVFVTTIGGRRTRPFCFYVKSLLSLSRRLPHSHRNDGLQCRRHSKCERCFKQQ